MVSRRNFIAQATAGTIAVMLSGCGGSDGETAPGSPPAPTPTPTPAPTPTPTPQPTFLPKGARNYAQQIVYPADALIQNGGCVYDVTKPPLASLPKAKGDGVADDTAALIAAFDHVLKLMANGRSPVAEITTKEPNGRYIIYCPNGIYRVTNTITYSGPTLFTEGWSAGQESVIGIKFFGETRDGAIIRLAPNSPGFSDPNAPRNVVQFIRPDVDFNNLAADTHGCRNLTVDVTNNRGAVGIAYWAANSGLITNVLIRADDNAGAIGLHSRTAVLAGYIQDVTVEGFDYAIRCDGGPVATSPVFEYLSLKNQRTAGISISRAGITIRNLAVSGGATAIEITGPSVQVILVDSDLNGGGSTKHAITQVANSHLHLRNVSVAGFAGAVQQGNQTKLALGTIAEYSSIEQKFTRAGRKALNLPIKDAPPPPYDSDVTKWVKPNGFDQTAVQAALSSGKPIIYFPSIKEYAFEAVNVPASTKFINGMSGEFSGVLTITENSSDPLFIIDMPRVVIDNKAGRTIVTYFAAGGGAIRNTVPGTEWYLCGIGGVNLKQFSSANVWGRWINSEGVSYLTVKNCNWMQMGYKSERQDRQPCISVSESSKFELLGAVVGTNIQVPILSVDASSQACAVMNNGHGYSPASGPDAIIDEGGTNLRFDSFPVREAGRNSNLYFYDVKAVNS